MSISTKAFAFGILLLGLLSGCGAALEEGERATSLNAEGPAAAPPVEAQRTVDQEAVGRAISGGQDEPVQRVRVLLSDNFPSRGAENPLVTIVEFSDFQCPFCSRANDTMHELMQRYPTTLRVVYVHNPLPFHPFARDAARAGVEAFRQGGSAKFFLLHDLMFDNQQALERADLVRYARQVGLDADAMQRALDSNTHDDVVQAQMDLAASLRALGTPMFYVNGRLLAGAQPIENFVEVVDDEVRRAQAAIAAGVPEAQLYAAFMERAGPPIDEDDEDTPAPSVRRVPDPSARYAVPTGDGPSIGPANALVTIVMFSDFQCPFCARVEDTLAELRRVYRNDVRIVWRNNPLSFHQNAEPAAEVALAAHADGKFWAMHDLLFQNREHLETDDLLAYARRLHLDVTRVRRAIETREFQRQIEADQAVATQFGANGTPAFFINGRYLAGAQPVERFRALIDEELPHARELVAHGTPRANVCAAVTANGATAPQTIEAPAPAPAPSPVRELDPNAVYALPIPADTPRRGGANATVVIQIMSDFQCPFCGRVEPTLAQLQQEFGDRVQFVWRNYPLPFHQNAMPAAEAAIEVFAQGGVEKFWAYHDLLFQNQQHLDRADLERFARSVGGINMTRFRRALDQHTHQARVEADMTAIRDTLGSIGTPTFLINGHPFVGAQPIENFRSVINAELANPTRQP